MDNPEKLATLCTQDAYFCTCRDLFEVFMYMQSNEDHPTVVRFTLILWVMLIIETFLVTPKCRTAMKALFLIILICVQRQCWIVSHVHLHSLPFLLINLVFI